MIQTNQYEWLYLCLFVLVLSIIFAHYYTVVSMGEDISRNLGVPVKRMESLTLVLIALTTSVTMITVGSLPFIGVIVPNIVRMRFGSQMKVLVPLTMLVGACLVLSCFRKHHLKYSWGCTLYFPSDSPGKERRRPMKKKTRIFLGILSVMVVLLVAAYLLIPTKNSSTVSNFILQRRFLKLLVMVIVSCAIPISTISFQTVVQNRFLTPGVLGIESLFVFIQSGLYYFESLVGVKVEQSVIIYSVTIAIQIGLLLLLMNASKGMMLSNFKVLLLLTMAFSMLLRNASTFLQVLMDPNEFDKLQSSLYPSFQKMNAQPMMIGVAIGLFVLLMMVFYRIRHQLDALHLGVDGAKMLGINTKRLSNVVIVIVIIMSSLSTILVGPLQFLGFMIANLTYQLTKEYKHGVLWLFSAVLGLVIVLAAQLIVERIFLLTIPISVFIEGIGGVLYLILLVKGEKPGAA